MSKIRDRIRAGKPATGTLQELCEWIVESFNTWTPAQQEEFRRQSMQDTYASLSKTQWEKQHPDRPYEEELRH
jgi:hypothetical protein